MTYPVIIAAPLLIAAILMAVRFVGCTQDFDQFDPQQSSYSDTVSSTDGLVSFWQRVAPYGRGQPGREQRHV
jgi:hypothetical protein